ncbi:ROK family protein [Ornithinimicrobium sp. Y1694]|uniref:ROK family protein n=1 Tax=Ornithinimicrobium sp. Y1694 TaxID=3418590 RepID=UPI003CFA5762
MAPATLPHSARQSTLRETNLGLVLKSVCAAPEPVSRAWVAATTGMTRSTVSRLVDDLVDGGLLEEGAARLAGPGRPSIPLLPTASRVGALGLQVNAAHVAARLLNLRGEVLAESRSEPDLVGSEPGEGLKLLGTHIAELQGSAPEGMRLLGAGLAVPGVVDRAGRKLLKAPNLGWTGVDPLAETSLSKALEGIPLSLGNEANLAAHAIAQPRPGRAGEHADFVYVSGEIGIGGAIVVEGHVQTGERGFAGEIGHVTYLPDGDPCPCGSRGCLERYAGRLAMIRRAGLPEGSTLALLRARAAQGHEGSATAVAVAGSALGVVLAGVINVVDVSTVVLGGEIGELADELSPVVQEALRTRVMAAPYMSLQVVHDEDDIGGATGAALVHLDALVSNPASFLEL